MSYQDALARAIEQVVAPNAEEVDRSGAFPSEAIQALAESGILGLISSPDVGGAGLGLDAASTVVAALAEQCGSTAMVVLMHYSATAAIEAHGPEAVRKEIGAGGHLSTLAFSEVGSRSHFWAPLSTARREGDRIRLDAHKSWVTAAGEADSYVWSSRPVEAAGPMTLWLVPSDTPRLSVSGSFDGLGLRGNASLPMTADGVEIPESARLGADGAGLDVALTVVLPWFLILNASASAGLMRGVVAETGRHLVSTRLDHLGQSLAEQTLPRVGLARMRLEADRTEAFIADTLGAVSSGREDAQLRVLEVKAAAAESAIGVTDEAMRVCGGAAFRKELGIERRFRDARAARVMAPTTDALLDFVGRAVCGLPLLEEASP